MAKKNEAASGTIKVTQTGSPIRREKDQRATLIGLGLNKMHKTRELRGQPRGSGHDPQGRAHGIGRGLTQMILPVRGGCRGGTARTEVRAFRPSLFNQRDKSESECTT